MKTAVLVNPAAGSAEQSEALRALAADAPGLTFMELGGPDSCDVLVSRVLIQGFEVVAAAGGDGTVNQVLNALVRQGGRAALGVVPLGTGNDLVRTLALGPDPRDALAQLSLARIERLDLIRVRYDDTVLYGINAATGGFGGEVSASISSELKATFGPLAYVIGAVSALSALDDYGIACGLDGAAIAPTDAVAVVVANGRTIAGGKRIAPLANPQDGLLDVILINSASLVELADVGARLVAGNLLGSRFVTHHRARSICLRGDTDMRFNVDGELISGSSVSIDVLPRAMPVVVGSEFRSEIAQP